MKIKILVSFPLDREGFDKQYFSEARWEYNFLEACLQDSRFKEIYTTKQIVNHPKVKISGPLHKIPYLMQGFQPEFFNEEPSIFFIGIYNTEEINEPTIINRIIELKNKGIKTVLCDLWAYENIKTNKDEIRRYLPVPYIKEKLDIARQRSVMFWNQKDASYPDYLNISKQIKDKYSEFKYLAYKNTDTKLIHIFEPLPLLNRKEVINIYKRAKLVLAPIKLGGAPIESMAYGCPFVSLNEAPVPVAKCKDILIASSLEEVEALTVKLIEDKVFYLETCWKYQEFGYNEFSYTNFCNHLIELIKEFE